MTQTLLISGPPSCGKTTWILNKALHHQGPCGYLRLAGYPDRGQIQARDGGIDRTYLQDALPELLDLSDLNRYPSARPSDLLALIELPQYQPPAQAGLDGIDQRVILRLEALQIKPDRHLHFGRNPELPLNDTLEFSALQSWSLGLDTCVWDPGSLSSFWFELVNGAYGDVYRAKALFNLPDGRAFFCNWIVSQEGSQFLPLQTSVKPYGRPERLSRLVVQGKDLVPAAIESTVSDCLLSDDVLEFQQAPLRQRQSQPDSTI